MDAQDPFAVITDAARRVIVSRVRDGYSKADDRFSEAEGSNGNTYGTDLYHMTWHGIATCAELEEMGFNCVVEQGRHRLILGSSVIACHRLGAYVPPNILLDVAGAPQVSLHRARQLGLPFPGHEHDEAFDPTCTLVIAHYGNPEDGCVGVFLQVPASGSAKDGAWADALKLWVPGDDLPPTSDDGTRPGVKVAAEIIEPPVVRRRGHA